MSKTIGEIKEFPKPVESDFIIKHGLGILATDGRYYHFSEVITLLKRFSQSQTQELQEKNAELLRTLQSVYNLLNVDAKISVDSIGRILTKHNHLKSKTNG